MPSQAIYPIGSRGCVRFKKTLEEDSPTFAGIHGVQQMTIRDNTHKKRLDTALVHSGRDSRNNHGFVNPPVIHASTVLFDSVETMQSGKARYKYGRRGTPTTEALESALNDLDGAEGSVLAPSGLAAIGVALQSCLSSGDHLLMVDTAYQPTRHLCDTVLQRMGIETEYYDPLIGSGIASLFRANTRAVFVESPGSLTFEMQDIPAIAEVAHAHDTIVLMDNTWATPLLFRPLDHGVDMSIQAGTKYIVGHSDVMIGTVSANARTYPALRATHGALGLHVGPDDVYLALRGLRTMGVRLERHEKNAIAVAEWLLSRPEVAAVRFPALPDDPGHAIWARDFNGASGLFSFELKPVSDTAVTAFLNALELFGLGYSWGGFESLAIWAKLETSRSATSFDSQNPLIRLHIGLEDPEDLIADLDAGFAQMHRQG